MATSAATLASARDLAAVRRPTNKWLVTLSISFGTLMGAIDSSIVNVALPHIRGAVGATVQEITWITTGYAIALVIVMPLTAFLGRRFGQKRVYLACLVLFLAGSALCGIARSLTALVLYRGLQGLGAGALQPTEQAILRQTFPLREQGMAMALFGMAVMLGPAVGPTLGGWIVDHWNWSWIFYINLPVGILGLFMVTTFVHEDPAIRAANQARAEKERKNVDWQGIALMSVGLAALEFFLEEGARYDWFESSTLSLIFLLALLALAAFVWRELTAPAPAVNLRLFKDPVFTSGTLIGALMFAILMANMFLLPIFMQELLGFTATQSGLALMPRVLVMMVATPIVGRMYNSVPPRIVIAAGVLFFAWGAWMMGSLTLESGSGDIISAIVVQGVGFACLFVPLTTVALSTISRERMADATGLNSLLRQIGGAIGLAIFATLLERWADVARAGLVPHLTAADPQVTARLARMQQAFIARGMDAVTAHSAALEALEGMVRRQAMMLSFDRVFVLAGVVFLFVLPLLFFLETPKSSEPAEVHLE